MTAVTGYAHPGYAASLAQFGTPRHLPKCDGWVLERPIPDFSGHDAMGCYPLFTCQDWSQLGADLEDLGGDLVSLSMVPDPFGEYNITYLQQCFKDVVIPFKQHYVVDLRRRMNEFVSPHHQRNARKALRDVVVEKCEFPAHLLEEWVTLYANLIERHTIGGISAFSKQSFARQLQVPGLVMFRAVHQETTIGMTLWYATDDIGYYHLAAYSDTGYALRASFALFWSALDYFLSAGLRWLNLGAGAGASGSCSDGLSRFKDGWSTGTRTAYFCGRIFDRARYGEIVQATGGPETSYFPAYRRGEFG